MKKHSNQKGFTLIEIVVVVVVLAILASLILPRFLAQPERVAITEAQETLGALRRAQHARIDLGQAVVNSGAANLAAGEWQQLGFAGVPGAGARFTYACGANSCTATRTIDIGAAGADTVELFFATPAAGTPNQANGSYVCASGYTAVIAATAFNQSGCATA